MTINEAVVNLTRYKDDHHSYSTDVIGKSIALGIEALRRIDSTRIVRKSGTVVLLPGETEE